jgi:hypothetical protein
VSPWEKRERGGLYYTRSRKEGGKVIREYIGAGSLGELAAKTDALKRLRREEEAKAWQEERDSLEAIDKALGELYETAEILTRATLFAVGYHQHKGEWRRRRMDKKRPNAEEQGAVVPATKASTPTKGAEVSRSRSELINELRPLVLRASEGDQDAPRRIRRALEETPDSAQILSNIVAKRAERIFVKKICGDDLLLREALSLQLEEMRRQIAGCGPSPLEELLSERVVACWLQLQQAEAVYASGLGKQRRSQGEYHERRLDRLHRRYLSAVHGLARMRKLVNPKVAEITLIERQLNVAAERVGGDS